MKIISILPLTENYSVSTAGAASLFIKEIDNNNKNLTVIGSTTLKDIINPKQYLNIKNISKLPKGRNHSYTFQIIKILKRKKFDLVEIHNRPQICLGILSEMPKLKVILYFHNDPGTLRNSMSVKDKLFLLKNCHKIIFISEWIKDQFFQNLKFKNSDKTEVIYHAPSVNSKYIKKEKTILFAGKLNSSKGYDIFCKTAEKFLKINNTWKFIVAGDEPREKIVFSHKRFIKMGWLSHDKVSKLFKKASIVIVPSMWDEPLGRVAIEASKSGCAVITSKRGGLLECSPLSFFANNPNDILLILKKLTKDSNLLNKIITNTKNYKFKKTEISFVRKKINSMRQLSGPKVFNINSKKPIKIIHTADLHLRHNGRLFYSTVKKLNNGFTSNGCNVQFFSDRDTLKYNKKIHDFSGVKSLNNNLIEFFSYFKPDILLLGHADNVSNDTLSFLKKIYKGVKFSQWFLDPIIKTGPDFEKNIKRFTNKLNLCDANFITVSPSALNLKNTNIYYLPNPVDASIDVNNIYENDEFIFDLFVAISHGQHRGNLKKFYIDPRIEGIKEILNSNYIKTNFFGGTKNPIWGDEFFYELCKCSMALNLSRGEPIKHYSSDRIASLMGNGVLTFINEKYQFSDFFSPKELITYKNQTDLIEKIKYYKMNYKERKLIAKNGKKKYFKLFNNNSVCKYMVDIIMDNKTSKNW